MEMVVHSKKSRFQQKFENKLFHFNRNSQLSSVCKKRSCWTTGVGVGQKIRLRLLVLLGIRLHPKTTDSLRLRNPAEEISILLQCATNN